MFSDPSLVCFIEMLILIVIYDLVSLYTTLGTMSILYPVKTLITVYDQADRSNVTRVDNSEQVNAYGSDAEKVEYYNDNAAVVSMTKIWSFMGMGDQRSWLMPFTGMLQVYKCTLLAMFKTCLILVVSLVLG